jgi:hypothetical protein
MMPTKQTCHKCGREFEGSDAIGYPCDNCLKEKDPNEKARNNNEIDDELFEKRLIDNIGRLS